MSKILDTSNLSGAELIRAMNDGPVSEGLALLPAKMDAPRARQMLLTIGRQESELTARRQYKGGPARGLLQFERGGGCRGVLTHPASVKHAIQVCEARGVEPTVGGLYEALEHDDALAFAMGRLLLWTDPEFLPALDMWMTAWAIYLRVWRPGKPHPDKWPGNYAAVRDALRI